MLSTPVSKSEEALPIAVTLRRRGCHLQIHKQQQLLNTLQLQKAILASKANKIDNDSYPIKKATKLGLKCINTSQILFFNNH